MFVADIVITHQDDEEKSPAPELRVLQLELKINQRQLEDPELRLKEYTPNLSLQASVAPIESETMRLSNHMHGANDEKTYRADADVKDADSIEGQSGIDGEITRQKTRQSEMVRQ